MDTLISPLDASAFENCSLGWLEKLSPDELLLLEAELRDSVDAQYARRANVEAGKQAEIDSECASDPLLWLENYTATENPLCEKMGLPFKAPFPPKSYFVPLFAAFRSAKRLFLPKTRDMLTSWCCMGDSTHRAQWHNWFTVVQTGAEKKAKELISYARILYENQPDWLRARHPLEGSGSETDMIWKNGGRVLAIPSGQHKLRLYHPSRYVMDEAAFLPEAAQCYATAHPVAQQIIAISSAGPGWFGDICQLPAV